MSYLLTYIGLVINYIYDKLKGSLKGEKENAKVHIEVEQKVGINYKKFKYDGPVSGLENSIEKFNINDFMEN